jgi:pimeloyl-ACP methyl ester carboxylesterase
MRKTDEVGAEVGRGGALEGEGPGIPGPGGSAEPAGELLRDHCEVRPGDPGKPEVYVLHGMLSNKDEARGYAEEWNARGHTTISCDARGHNTRFGESSPFDWIGTLRDYDAILRERGGPAILTGESMGGTLALSLGALRPGPVEKVFAFSALHEIDPGDYMGEELQRALGLEMDERTDAAMPKHFLECVPGNEERFFLVHGTRDLAVPLRNFEANRERLCLPRGNTLAFSTGDHGDVKSKPPARAFLEEKMGW